MRRKRVLIITIGAIIILILAAGIAAGTVIASTNITIKSNVNVSYQVTKDIYGSVSAEYNHAGSTYGIGSIVYKGNELEGDTQNLDVNKVIDLSVKNDYVEFMFHFTNNGNYDYIASLSYIDNETAPLQKDSNIVILTKSSLTNNYELVSNGSFPTLNVPYNLEGKITYYVKVQLNSISKDAEFSGTFKWNLVSNVQD